VKRPLVAVVLVAGGALATAGVSFGASSVKVAAGSPSEFHFKLSGKARPGTVSFRITNRGEVKHDFKIAGKKTRLIAPNRSATLKVKLKKGSYRYLCTVPGHADAGMKGKLTVR
jgi:uncharacterized cupredoxin-like copper-binding protein